MSFHTELSSFLLKCVDKKIADEGLPEKSYSIEDSFEEILQGYHALLHKKPVSAIEQKLLNAFPPHEFPLKMMRGLPRLYKKDDPKKSFIKAPFAHVPSIMRLGVEKFLLPLYDKFDISEGTQIAIFTHILSDGFGDLVAHKEVLTLLKSRFPKVKFQSIVTLPKRFSKEEANLGLKAILVPYKVKSTLPKRALNILKESDLILSIPTHHPEVSQLPNVLSIGEHGFIESEAYHPKTSSYSMGLHFLEKGILIRKKEKKADFRQLKNETLLFTLFGTLAPQSVDIETYLVSHKLHLAYLTTPVGGAIYLHALLKAAGRDERTIDICTPDIDWLIEFLKKQGKEKKPFLFDDFGIQELEIHFSGKIHRKRIQDSGKKVRILCTGPLSSEDFSVLMRLSQEFVGVRGDQSFSEAVSANKLYFYDGAPHKKFFVKDLLALAENRLNGKKEALTLFRSIAKACSYSQKEEADEWVEETHFQPKEPWEETAISLSHALLKRETLIGCKQLNEIICSEYSFNQTLCQLTSRAILHEKHPELAKREQKGIDEFVRGEKPLGIIVKEMNELLKKSYLTFPE